jgi:hypothetical protein
MPLEQGFHAEHLTNGFESVFCKELQTLLTTYNKDLQKVVGASGQEAPSNC